MTHPLRSLSGIFLVLVVSSSATASTSSHYWSSRYGSTSDDRAMSVAVDASGNVCMAGYFGGTVNFGGSNLASAGAADIFVARYNSYGAHQWSKRAGSTSDDAALDITVDASGNVFVTGYFNGTVNFGGSNLVSAGGRDVFLVKYNPAGTHQWSQRFGGTLDDMPYEVACDAPGGPVVAGFFYGTANFGGSNLASSGQTDVFLAKYDATGAHQWSQRFGGTSYDEPYGLAIDATGNEIITGLFAGTAGFGGANLVSAGGYDIFLAKYNSSGAHQWSKRLGLAGYEQGSKVATDASGNIFLAGWYGGTTNVGGVNLASNGSDDIYLAKYNSAGAHLWSTHFGGGISDQPFGLAVDAGGRVLLSGYFGLSADFGGGYLASAGDFDVFTARFTTGGVHEWSVRFGGTAADAPQGLAVTPAGYWAIAGYFNGSASFGGSTFTSTGVGDIFIGLYGPEPAEPGIVSITDIGNDQGRAVKIRFVRSGYDAGISPAWITAYEVYRRDDPPPAAAGAQAAARRRDDGWTLVGSVTAHTKNSYGIDVATIGDSTVTTGPYYSTYFVRAATAVPGPFYDSAPDSGYSLDNLAPGVPGGLALTAGVLTWNESGARDLDHYTVYGAALRNFRAGIEVDECQSATLDVSASPYAYYYVTATDRAGNESKPAMIDENGIPGPGPVIRALSVTNHPNPFNPSTTVNYTVPARGAVTIDIFDALGAHLATLVDHAVRGPGAYSARWNGRNARGELVSSGVYFARIEHNGMTRTHKMVLLK